MSWLLEAIMGITRRDFVEASSALVAAALDTGGAAAAPVPSARKIRRIATEEAWSIPEHMNGLAGLARSVWDNLDIEMHRGKRSGAKGGLGVKLIDTDERLREMDRLGIDMHILSLTSPGVQVFDPDTATAMAALANDRMAEIVSRNPARFGGLASFAPQDPARAAKEMDRAINRLKLNGFIVNSSTNNEYLDERKYWDIFEAAEALNAAIYIHPRCPSDGMAQPFRGYDMSRALWGYACETGTHAVRLMLSGVFDRFPRLKIVLGHMGENISFHIWRTNHFMLRRPAEYPAKLPPMEVFQRNFVITTSGMGAFGTGEIRSCVASLRYCIDTFGADNVMWAIDYPYEEMAPAVKFMNEVEISESDRHKIYHGTAERVFHVAEATV